MKAYDNSRPRGMGVKHSLQTGGTLLSFLANILKLLSTSSNYWIRYHGGHSGLWQECSQGTCSNTPCQTMLSMTGACMVLATGFGVLATVMGLRILCQQDGSLRGQQACACLFLVGYTVKNAWKNDVFFSWSYFSGWLALPFSILAGLCFLLADMIVQSTDAISSFPVCL